MSLFPLGKSSLHSSGKKLVQGAGKMKVVGARLVVRSLLSWQPGFKSFCSWSIVSIWKRHYLLDVSESYENYYLKKIFVPDPFRLFKRGNNFNNYSTKRAGITQELLKFGNSACRDTYWVALALWHNTKAGYSYHGVLGYGQGLCFTLPRWLTSHADVIKHKAIVFLQYCSHQYWMGSINYIKLFCTVHWLKDSLVTLTKVFFLLVSTPTRP